MPIIATQRMDLLPLTRSMVTRRLESDRFSLRCTLSTGTADVEFPPSWPGDALVLFPRALEALAPAAEEVEGTFVAVLLQSAVAVGQLGTKGPPTAEGEQEIGYGFGREVWGRGLATEAVTALTGYLLHAPAVRAVTAETATTNAASARVLQKAGFVQSGTSWDEDDGDLLLWRREA